MQKNPINAFAMEIHQLCNGFEIFMNACENSREKIVNNGNLY